MQGIDPDIWKLSQTSLSSSIQGPTQADCQAMCWIWAHGMSRPMWVNGSRSFIIIDKLKHVEVNRPSEQTSKIIYNCKSGFSLNSGYIIMTLANVF